jgi:hypothetical protein
VQLSPHFSLAELTRTSQVDRQATNYAESFAFHASLCSVANMLEVVRSRWDRPIRINSGFRGPSVNANTPGASPVSQHSKGEAVDFEIPGLDDAEVFRWIVTESGLAYGQCILERPPGRSWIHLSLGEPWRAPARCRQALTFDGVTYRAWRP